MTFHEFEDKARLYVVGELDEDDLPNFRTARREFGGEAERFINECQKLAAVFALSLCPDYPPPQAKERLFSLIRGALHER